MSVNNYTRRNYKVEAIKFDGSVACVNAIARWAKATVTEKIIKGDIFLELKYDNGSISGHTLTVGQYLVKHDEDFWVYTAERFAKQYEEVV